jgi:hypothetical protein
MDLSQERVLEVVKHYTDLAYKPYFMIGDVVVRIKDHLANWSNFEQYNMDNNAESYRFLSIVIAEDKNNGLLRESTQRLEDFEERMEYDNVDYIAREYIYSPETPAQEIITDIDFAISKMQQGKRNFEVGGYLGRLAVKGDCYQVASTIALRDFKYIPTRDEVAGKSKFRLDGLQESDEKWSGIPYVVQAQVEGQGMIYGLVYGHSWIEDDLYVYDFSNGRSIRMLKDDYYFAGNVQRKAPRFYKYTFEEARKKMVKTKHYGSWDLKTDSGL